MLLLGCLRGTRPARWLPSVARQAPLWRQRFPLRLEQLEDRLAPAVIAVTTRFDDVTPNDGSVSLREAIIAINAGSNLGDPDIIVQNPGIFGTSDSIRFSILGSAPFQINVGSSASAPNIPLPQITSPVVIDGTTQPGFAGNPIVVVNGASAGANANGFDIELSTGTFSRGATIKGLVINGFSANGIKIGPDNVSSFTTSDTTITGNYIGTDVTGTTGVANSAYGIFINGVDSNNLSIAASDNLITDNVISGNTSDGVLIQANANGVAAGNTITGNFIGLNAAGTAALPNGLPANLGQTGSSGVEIISASGNTVGGSGHAALTAVPGTGNVISGNSVDGVHVLGTLTHPADVNVVQGNFIGVSPSGVGALGNARLGIEVSGAKNTSIGGNVVGANGAGIEVDNGGQNNVIQGNFSGVGACSCVALPAGLFCAPRFVFRLKGPWLKRRRGERTMFRFHVSNERDTQQLEHASGVIEFGRGPKRGNVPRCIIQDPLRLQGPRQRPGTAHRPDPRRKP